MKIIVAGCGKIGSAIISSLVAEGHDVVAIDNNDIALSNVTNVYDVMGVCGNAADCDVLSECGMKGTQLFIAATNSDDTNMLCCFMAKKMGAEHTIARIRNPEYNDRSLNFMRQHLELSMAINPELLVAQELFRILKLPSALKIEYFSHRNLEMIEIKLKEGSPLNGLSIRQIRDKFDANFLVCAVRRKEEVYIPDGSFELLVGDSIGVMASPNEIQKLFKLLGFSRKQAKNVMILGGNRTSYYLAKMLCNIGNSVKIIEENPEDCQQLAELLPKAMVIEADGSTQEVLMEEGLADQDAFVALSAFDEENVLLSLFASTQNVPKVIAKITREELAGLADQIGLDCIASPNEITTNIIVRFARALENSLDSNVETLYKLMDGKAEALEFIVKQDSRLTNKPLKELDTKKNTLIAGIIRGRKTIIPSGDDVISVGDHVVVLVAGQRIQDLTDILK